MFPNALKIFFFTPSAFPSCSPPQGSGVKPIVGGSFFVSIFNVFRSITSVIKMHLQIETNKAITASLYITNAEKYWTQNLGCTGACLVSCEIVQSSSQPTVYGVL